MATILVVDDIAANRELLVTLLRHRGHRLLQAADGAEGLGAAHAERPDLVITDGLMPVMDGFELVRQLRLDPDTARIPVILCTAHYAERDARALALSSGVAAVLTKPVEPEEALRVVDAVLAAPARGTRPTEPPALANEFDREHLRLVTDKLSLADEDLRGVNARLRALVNVGLALASERDPERLLESVCHDARELLGAVSATLGILRRDGSGVERVVGRGVAVEGWLALGTPLPEGLAPVVEERRTLRGEDPAGGVATLGLPPSHPRVRVWLAAPVASPSHVYGWLCLARDQAAHFTADDEALLTALAGQVGRIYENGYFYRMARDRARELEREVGDRARAEEEARHRAELSALGAAVGLSLAGSGSLADVLGQCAEALAMHLDAACTRIWSTVDGMLELQASAGSCPSLPGTRVPLDDAVVGRVARERSPRVVDDVRGHPGVADPEWARRERVAAFAAYPLMVADRVVGVAALFTRRPLTEAEAATLASLAHHLAVGIERHRQAEALRTAEERTRFALRSANVGIWDADYATGEVRWSETLEAQYGIEPGSFGGTFDEFMALVHPDDRGATMETIERAGDAGTDFTVMNRAVWADGTVRWLRGIGRVLLGDDGRPARAVGVSLDVTERRTLEQRYQQAQKMEAIGRLAGGVAHDFNNILTVVNGYSELLLGTPGLDPAAGELVREIAAAGERAASLTRQLLAFSRQQVVETRPLDLNDVVVRAEGMLRRLVGEDVMLSTALSPALHTVIADPGQMEQVIMNLVVNARDAMPHGGRLTLETANVELDDRFALPQAGLQPGPHVMLAVSDTGVGMTPEVLAHLFEPFFSTKGAEGTGLGLATVHGIVRQSGGYVSVYSEPGLGSTFKVYLPAVAEDAVPVPLAPAQQSSPRGTETILLVEDEDGVRALCRAVLESCGYTVLAAAGASEALRLAAAHGGEVRLLLTDVVMPEVGGRRLAEQVEALCPRIAVLYISGYTDDAVIRHGVLQADTAFLQKPFAPAALAAKVRAVLDRAAAGGGG
jgi:PAS domain S-box-containing protein